MNIHDIFVWDRFHKYLPYCDLTDAYVTNLWMPWNCVTRHVKVPRLFHRWQQMLTGPYQCPCWTQTRGQSRMLQSRGCLRCRPSRRIQRCRSWVSGLTGPPEPSSQICQRSWIPSMVSGNRCTENSGSRFNIKTDKAISTVTQSWESEWVKRLG